MVPKLTGDQGVREAQEAVNNLYISFCIRNWKDLVSHMTLSNLSLNDFIDQLPQNTLFERNNETSILPFTDQQEDQAHGLGRRGQDEEGEEEEGGGGVLNCDDQGGNVSSDDRLIAYKYKKMANGYILKRITKNITVTHVNLKIPSLFISERKKERRCNGRSKRTSCKRKKHANSSVRRKPTARDFLLKRELTRTVENPLKLSDEDPHVFFSKDAQKVW